MGLGYYRRHVAPRIIALVMNCGEFIGEICPLLSSKCRAAASRRQWSSQHPKTLPDPSTVAETACSRCHSVVDDDDGDHLDAKTELRQCAGRPSAHG